MRQQNNENVASVMAAETALKDQYRAFETQARDRKGVNAWDVTNDAQAFWEKQTADIAGNLANDEQRGIFKLTANELRQRSLDSFSRFEANERRAAVEGSTKASIAGSIDLAARHPTDAEALAASRDDVVKRVAMMGQANGWTPERLEVESQRTLTELHAQVLENLVDVDPAAAREYFTANKGDIAGAELDTLNNLINTGELRAKAQSATDSILAEGLSEAEALKKARDNYEGDERDEIVRRIKTRYAENSAADAEREREVADAAWKLFSQTGKVSSLPAAMLDSLDGKTLIAMRKAEAGGPTETDWGLYYQLRQQAANDPEAFASRDLRQDFGSLKESERRQLIALQEAVNNPANLPEAGSTEKQIEVALNLLEIDDDEDKGKFQSAVYSEIAAFTNQAGREPTYDERQKIVDRLMLEGEVPGKLFDRNARLYEVVGTDDTFIADIPDDDRRDIIEALQAHGDTVTEAAIIDLFIAAQSLR